MDTKIVRFTPTELEILEHRFEIEDCIADALEATAYNAWMEFATDLNNSPENVVYDLVLEAAPKLWKKFKTGTVDFSTLSPLEMEIVSDVIAGNTFFASSEDAVHSGEISRGWLMSRQKTAYKLQEKLRAVGIMNNIPSV